jgi:hypothetical protein
LTSNSASRFQGARLVVCLCRFDHLRRQCGGDGGDVLPADKLEAAPERGKAIELDAIVADLLVEE